MAGVFRVRKKGKTVGRMSKAEKAIEALANMKITKDQIDYFFAKEVLGNGLGIKKVMWKKPSRGKK